MDEYVAEMDEYADEMDGLNAGPVAEGDDDYGAGNRDQSDGRNFADAGKSPPRSFSKISAPGKKQQQQQPAVPTPIGKLTVAAAKAKLPKSLFSRKLAQQEEQNLPKRGPRRNKVSPFDAPTAGSKAPGDGILYDSPGAAARRKRMPGGWRSSSSRNSGRRTRIRSRRT